MFIFFSGNVKFLSERSETKEEKSTTCCSHIIHFAFFSSFSSFPSFPSLSSLSLSSLSSLLSSPSVEKILVHVAGYKFFIGSFFGSSFLIGLRFKIAFPDRTTLTSAGCPASEPVESLLPFCGWLPFISTLTSAGCPASEPVGFVKFPFMVWITSACFKFEDMAPHI